MSGGRGRRLSTAALLGLAIGSFAACGPMAASPFEEHMPAPASIWLSADPASPERDVDVALIVDGEVNRSHTFPAGEPIRASFPLGEGPDHRLTALGDSCQLDLDLPPEREVDVLLTLGEGGTCRLDVANGHPYEQGHGEPSVLVTP